MSSSKKIVILYGSETGNAHDFATILSHRLHRWHFSHTFCSIGDYDPQDILKCRYLFIICSTTGQGELPRNVNALKGERPVTFWSFLKRKNLPSNLLNHIQTAMLGLGDSSYPKFNYGIRKLHQRIVTQLGANELFDRLEADDQAMAGSNKGTGLGIESVYFEYEKKVLSFLLSKYPNRKVNGQIIKREELDPEVYLEPASYLQLSDEHANEKFTSTKVIFEGDESLKVGRVNINKRITSEGHFQDVRQFKFSNVDKIQENYEPGDTVTIYPCNTDEDVSKFLANQSHWLEIADKPLNFTSGVPNDLKDGGLVRPMTLRNLLKYHCDFMSIPRTSFFLKIWTFATDVTKMERGQEQLNDQREKLRQFATDQDMQDLYDYCNRPRRSILEVLEDFISVKLPWKYVLDYLPIIKPRYYSISSGPGDPNIELTVAIVKYKTILRKIRRGICTNYIARLQEGEQIRYKLQNNHIIKKEFLNKPMILVGPGVGLAPLLSVVKAEISKDIKLLFGCRYKDKDYIYKDMLEDWFRKGKIALHSSFSRDEENSPGVKYVQDYLWRLGEEITNLVVNKDAVFFLCGSSGKMPIQVRLTFIEMLKKWGNFSDEETAKKYLKEMEKSDRYIQETW